MGKQQQQLQAACDLPRMFLNINFIKTIILDYVRDFIYPNENDARLFCVLILQAYDVRKERNVRYTEWGMGKA